jgi:hypothetical protein
VGLKFVFIPHGGSYSLVGTDCIKSDESTTMNFGWLDASTIMHEFGHVLGMIHEHQNPKGKPIAWDDSKVYQWAMQTQGWDQTKTYHNIIERYNVDQLNASKFDWKILLYILGGLVVLGLLILLFVKMRGKRGEGSSGGKDRIL